MASIRKRNNRWEVRVRRNGYPTQTKTLTLKSDALQWAREAEIALEKGELLINPQTETMTLRTAVNRYIDEVALHHKGVISEQYRLRCIEKLFGSQRQLRAITAKDVSSYKVKRQKLVASATVRRELNLLSSLFETAKNEWGLVALCNPTQSIKRPADSLARDRRLKPHERMLLLSESQRSGHKQLYLAIQIALNTGMRQGEILKLNWDDIDFKRNQITVRDTKNGSNRVIVLPSVLKAELLNTKRKHKTLFTITASGIQQAFRKFTNRLQIHNLRFHDLRHEAISSLFEMGLSVPEVQLMSGHRTLDQLMRYSHSSLQNIQTKLVNS
ncbi:MAG: integrase [Candidatus Puniceispirillaceae bacterium]